MSDTRYSLRLSARNVRGVVQIPSVSTYRSALAIAHEWVRSLGPGWSVEMVDSDGYATEIFSPREGQVRGK